MFRGAARGSSLSATAADIDAGGMIGLAEVPIEAMFAKNLASAGVAADLDQEEPM